MKIIDILQKKRTLSFELFPPKTPEGLAKIDSVIQSMSEAKTKPDFMSITCGAGGTPKQNTVKIASIIQAHNVPALAHFPCIAESRETIEKNIGLLKNAKIENVLALRGDMPESIEASTVSSGEFLHASDLARVLRDNAFCVGGACYPEKHPESVTLDSCIDALKIKLDAGISFFTTQMFFSNEIFYDFLHLLQNAGISAPVIAGIMPVTHPSQIEKMLSLSAAFIPPVMSKWLERYKNAEDDFYKMGIESAVTQITGLQKNGVAGIHIYSMNKAKVVQDIVNAL